MNLGGSFGNLYVLQKHKDWALSEKRRPVVPGFAAPDKMLQNRLDRVLYFLIESLGGQFNVSSTQDIVVPRRQDFNGRLAEGSPQEGGSKNDGGTSVGGDERIFDGYIHECYPEGVAVEQTSEGLEWLLCGMRLTVGSRTGVSAKMTMKNVEAGTAVVAMPGWVAF
ncbi:hypothetical protein CYMTET_6107 [Cymbomonas tetramitiformis]|uniref:Uncharacterized protein n=1 Tax=Cymbomonas tetramitiformis TaxID=36881 RepID=A0AAE0GY32_9CHLO|nr:hypothetical protein CYMTET_6107 [Cymbomonas tetramitiformis]